MMSRKQHSGIRRGGGGKALEQAQAELKQTRGELEKTQTELKQLQADYEDLLSRINSINDQLMSSSQKANSKYTVPTVTNMKSAYDELHKFREFPRVADLRRELDWSREDFDEMIRTLRDNRTINLFRADESMLTKDEIRDSFTDERGFKQGLIIWNDR